MEYNQDNIIDKTKEMFILYILILKNFDIIDIDQTINIFFGFYKINFNVIENRELFIKLLNYLLINQNKDFLKLSKYMTFIYVISKINKEKVEFINLLNKSKLYQKQNKKIKLDEYDICTGDLYHNNAIFACIKENLIFLKRYIESFEFFGKKNNLFTFGFLNAKEEYQNIHKQEIINRIKAIKTIFGIKLINFILYKKNRKKDKKDYLDLYEEEFLSQLEYVELLKYAYKFFHELNNNLDSYLKDFEFGKYLKVIMISFIDDFKDKITQKLHEKLIKKYIIFE